VLCLLYIYQIGLATDSRLIFSWYETSMYVGLKMVWSRYTPGNILKPDAGTRLVLPEEYLQPPQRQTLLSIKPCSRIVQILLLSDIDGSFCRGHFNSLKVLFSTMDSNSDYYSSRCKDINGFWVFKGTFMTLVSRDSNHEMVFYCEIKELCRVLG
jgi:hypothetical protein